MLQSVAAAEAEVATECGGEEILWFGMDRPVDGHLAGRNVKRIYDGIFILPTAGSTGGDSAPVFVGEIP